MLRTLLLIVALGLPFVAHAQPRSFSTSPHPDIPDPVECETSLWTSRADCAHLKQQRQTCLAQGGTDFDMMLDRCVMPRHATPPKSQEQTGRELMENAQRSDMCGTKMTAIIEAESWRSNGYSQAQTAGELVSKYAYGPGGQVYRGSAGAEAAVRSWVAEVYQGKYPMGMNFQSIYTQCMAGR